MSKVKTGLVLEGGAMRGIFSAGVLDYMLIQLQIQLINMMLFVQYKVEDLQVKLELSDMVLQEH